MSARRTVSIAIASLFGCAAIASADPARPPRLLFNTTASAPIGLYVVAPGRFVPGDLVAVSPPPHLQRWLAARRYLPANVPLLKIVAAAQGRQVCGVDGGLYIDGRRRATAKPRDRLGRRLPVFTGCRRLGAGEVFLLNADAPDSLDSRYFGPIPQKGVIGRARAVWTWAARS